MSTLTIGGVSVALYARLAMDVQITPHPSGRRAIQIQASGTLQPDLSTVDFGQPVTIAWTDHLGDSHSITALCAGIQQSDDVAQAKSSWTLTGVEALGGQGAITISGTDYWGAVQVDHDGARKVVALSGESAGTSPVIAPGLVTIASELFSGEILTGGSVLAWDPDVALFRWSLAGETTERLSLSIGGVTLSAQACAEITVELTRHSSGRRGIAIRGSGLLPPAIGSVTWSAPVAVGYTGAGGAVSITILSAGPVIGDNPKSPRATWSLDGVEAGSGVGLVTIGSTTYWATVDVQVQGGKSMVSISGDAVAGGAPSTAAGTVTVATGLFSGDLWTDGVARTWDPDTGLTAWTLAGVSLGTADLTVAGVSIARTACLDLAVDVAQDGTGRRTLRLRASGATDPGLGSVDWSEPVTVAYPTGAGGSASITVLSPGLQREDDARSKRINWSIEGTEAAPTGGAGVVTVDGGEYPGAVEVEYLGGAIQRMSNGLAEVMYAWIKRRVRLTGEPHTSAPEVSPGVVTVASALYSGDLVTLGTRITVDPATGLKGWELEGEEEEGL